ncbi:variable surface protein [Plasmodium gonderi]|uniref:Variable surface protein n=1 Tax=Plasmodium gonderi TaxID=77519 RepID=A0A1Y1JPH3_PLAGO|nr:variable surface protein [Plasmodium gonderi]GAW84150.1 variable surface protein [Plasmodium gonderi]
MPRKNDESNFNFTGLYPECRNEFDQCSSKMHGLLYTSYSAICSDFRNNINARLSANWKIEVICIQLLFYLHDIIKKKHELNDNIKARCNYFYYKLLYIVKKYGGGCGKGDECYKYFTDIDEKTLEIMEYLDEIYNLINEFTISHNRTTDKTHKFKWWIEKLENHPYKNESNLNEELAKIILKCEEYRKNWNDKRFDYWAALLLTDSWMNTRKMSLNRKASETTKSIEEHTESLETKRVGAQPLMNTVADDVKNTGISIGTVFITFSILIIIFILYKYTPYYSFIKPRVHKLRKKLKKITKMIWALWTNLILNTKIHLMGVIK